MKRIFLLQSICLLVSIKVFGKTKLTENILLMNNDAVGEKLVSLRSSIG